MKNMAASENVFERKDDSEMNGLNDRKDANDTMRTERSVLRRDKGKSSSTDERVNENGGKGTTIKANTTIKAEQRLILGDTEVLGAFFRGLYAVEGWTTLHAAPLYPSGPVPKVQGGLATRRMTDPMARFYVAVTMAEAALLVRCVAHDAGERHQLNVEIDGVLGLSTAVASGRIGGFVVCWKAGRYPKTPTTIRILTVPGQRTRSQVLGTLDGEIRKFVDAIMTPLYGMVRRVSSSRQAGPPGPR